LTPTIIHTSPHRPRPKKSEGRRQKEGKPSENKKSENKKTENKKEEKKYGKNRPKKPLFQRYRKAPAFIKVDAETLKFYVMQQM
jgi:hypothetical protein